ncbi:MAG: hypothetical protein QOE70_3001 [Chthoniobacter sp.]|jgi:hypothetical protein|nr:hypothetical protein [Chthoniobacter sp.]
MRSLVLFRRGDRPQPRDTARIIRAHLASHNLRVALLSLLTLAVASGLWLLLYAVSHWLTLLFVTAVKGIDSALPKEFPELFWVSAAALLALAWLDHLLHPDARPKDHKSVGEIVLDLVLAIPRATLAVWSTLSAWQHLSASDLAQAAALVERLAQERRLRLQSLPLEIPDAAQRFKILFALQIVQIIDIRREDRELWVALNPLRPAELGGEKTRDAISETSS